MAEVVLVIDEGSGALAAGPGGGGNYSYQVDSTGGNKNCGSDAQTCPTYPPCTNQGEGTLKDVSTFQQGGTDGLIRVQGAVGDPTLLVTIAIPATCGTTDLGYLQLPCGNPDGFQAKSDGDGSYRLEGTCHTDQSRPNFVNVFDGQVSGTLAPLNGPTPPDP